MLTANPPEEEEKKDITLRGVNKELYDLFSEHRTKHGLSVGDAFNELIFITLKQPWRMHGFRRMGPPILRGVIPEKISDLDNLRVSKKDLTAAGESTMFLFKQIKKLTFEKDVDGPTLVKHVKLISSSDVDFLGAVPKLVQLGLLRKKLLYEHPQDKESLKDITIRNVTSPLFDEFVAKAKSEGKTTGEYFSELLDHFIPFTEIVDVINVSPERDFLMVKNENELTILKEDLDVLGERGVIFYGIKQIIFSDEIPQELFLKTILKIINCQSVILPKSVPRLIAISRTARCKQINFN